MKPLSSDRRLCDACAAGDSDGADGGFGRPESDDESRACFSLSSILMAIFFFDLSAAPLEEGGVC
jgi:hypothetical protein